MRGAILTETAPQTMFDSPQIHRKPESADPDPLTILALCFAGVSMVASAGNTVTNVLESRRKRREERRATREDYAQILISRDRVRYLGDSIVAIIQAMARDARIAIAFLEPARGERPATYAIGKQSIELSQSDASVWNLLVDNVCDNIKALNRLLLEYSVELRSLIEQLTKYEVKYERSVSGLIKYVSQHQQRLNSHIQQFQALSQKSSLQRAVRLLEQTCIGAENLIREIETAVVGQLPEVFPG